MIPLNAILRRKVPEGDLYDRLRVVGRFDAGDHGIEVVLSPVDGFASPLTAAPDYVGAEYQIEDPEQPVAAEPVWEAGP